MRWKREITLSSPAIGNGRILSAGSIENIFRYMGGIDEPGGELVTCSFSFAIAAALEMTLRNRFVSLAVSARLAIGVAS